MFVFFLLLYCLPGSIKIVNPEVRKQISESIVCKITRSYMQEICLNSNIQCLTMYSGILLLSYFIKFNNDTFFYPGILGRFSQALSSCLWISHGPESPVNLIHKSLSIEV